MRYLPLCVLLSSFLLTALPLSGQERGKEDKETRALLRSLQGRWELTAIEQGGKPGYDPEVKLVIKDDTYITYRKGKLVESGKIRLTDVDKDPVGLHLVNDNGDKFSGIMDISRGQLKYSVAMPGTAVPTSWRDSKGASQVTCTYTREKDK
jgi:uncharacterized protein (TIGR03067 family)